MNLNTYKTIMMDANIILDEVGLSYFTEEDEQRAAMFHNKVMHNYYKPYESYPEGFDGSIVIKGIHSFVNAITLEELTKWLYNKGILNDYFVKSFIYDDILENRSFIHIQYFNNTLSIKRLYPFDNSKNITSDITDLNTIHHIINLDLDINTFTIDHKDSWYGSPLISDN